MPGFIANTDYQQQQRQALPGPLRSILDLLMPADDVMGAAMPQTVIAGPSKGLMEALKPLGRGSLDRGKELARELSGRAMEYMRPKRPQGGSPAQKLADFFMKASPEAADPNKLAALDKVTGVRPPQLGQVTPPEGFSLEQPMLGRDPGLEALTKIWDNYMQIVGNKKVFGKKADRPPLSSLFPDQRPPLSSANKSRSGRVGLQKQALDSNLKKPDVRQGPPSKQPAKPKFKFKSGD